MSRPSAERPNGDAAAAGDPESTRLAEDARRERNWKRWGPYLAERQWGTVREDYSPDGAAWDYFPHEQARSRVYRWGEDGLLGFSDREGRLCFGLALWNERDPILKERLFGLSGPEGNHGEDVKELYFYLDGTPTHSYMSALYKYPQSEFPYARLLEENRKRGKEDREYEITDTGVFDDGRYFDIGIEYAKAAPDDLLIRVTIANRGPVPAVLHLLPTLWFRNTWAWGRTGEAYWPEPEIRRIGPRSLLASHASLGRFRFDAQLEGDVLFTDNETNVAKLFGAPNPRPYVKDAFHEAIVHGRREALRPEAHGTKAAIAYRLEIPSERNLVVRFRLSEIFDGDPEPLATSVFGREFDEIIRTRLAEADRFYARRIANRDPEERRVMRQAYAGLLWSKQFYHYIVKDWLDGDPGQPAPPAERRQGRNREWEHLYNRDIVSMPDKWEYPWYAAWDLAFHMIPFAEIDPEFAKQQLILFLREWYLHPNGQLPAYEFAFGDVNPPVHAWAAWRVYKMTGRRGARDRNFLARVFQKLLLNFTWWVNRKDVEGKNVFRGGFLGLDNIGVFDRSRELPTGGHLEQADGTAWMAFYCATMLSMALELAAEDPSYEDIASKFFEHFVAITDAMNDLGGRGLWDEGDGFYYDQLSVDGKTIPLRLRSMVGLIPLFAVEVLREDVLRKLPGFTRRLDWFLTNRPDLARHVSATRQGRNGREHRLLSVAPLDRLTRVLRYLLDETEFLGRYGIRSLSRIYAERPYRLHVDGTEYRVDYVAGESTTGLFGGNSNWRGPVWFPVNYLLIESLQRHHYFYGDDLRVECPVGSGHHLTLGEVSAEISRRLSSLFLPDPSGTRPALHDQPWFAVDPHFKDLLLFHEYFDGDSGRGCGASHQTGWTSLVLRCLADRAKARGEVKP